MMTKSRRLMLRLSQLAEWLSRWFVGALKKDKKLEDFAISDLLAQLASIKSVPRAAAGGLIRLLCADWPPAERP
jgi:hypothetical protein